jgi:DNA mismatch repair protein MutL
MERDDALMALERHATSKLATFEDLGAIATLGFRGEALPSIAAVSRFLLRTAARDGCATEIEARAGRIVGVRDVERPRGTTTEVGGLFFNVPARRKFLKAAPTELAHIVRTVTHYALAHPSVRFLLEHEGRRLIDAPRAADRALRIAQVHGHELAGRLVPFASEQAGVRVSGFATVRTSTRRDVQHVFVNGRLVQTVLMHAIATAYGNTLARGLYRDAPIRRDRSREVDVNVRRRRPVRFDRSSDARRGSRRRSAALCGKVPELSDLRPRTAASATPPSPLR